MKLFYTFLGTGLIAIVAILAYAGLRPNQYSNQSVNCESLPESRLAKQRSLGLIIANRQLLSLQLNNEGNFSPPGGNAEGSESLKDTLERELTEELKFDSKDLTMRSYQTLCSRDQEGGIVRNSLFLVDLPEEDLTIVEEGDALKWVDYTFIESKKADQDLIQALSLLKKDGLID